jgi:hypothetical protein
VSAKSEYAAVLSDLDPLAQKLATWGQLTYFTATVAEAAQDYGRALFWYEKLKGSGRSPIPEKTLETKIATMAKAIAKIKPALVQSALKKFHEDAAFATRVLNKIFDLQLDPPPIELLEDEEFNAYFDGEKIHIPAVVQDIPDIVTHEATWPFIQAKWKNFDYTGQSGAIAQSYTDILTTVVKQTRLGQQATDADWVIAPGAVAWLTGKISQIGTDRRPLRSLKSPGSAYDDPVLGKDPQVNNLNSLTIRTLDNGEVHTNSGIPNNAFYETAIRIGSDKATKIWVASLGSLKPSATIPELAQTTYSEASSLYGKGSQEVDSVNHAWRNVGVTILPIPK